MSKEMEDVIRDPAMVTAAFLGRMAMRGEGQKPDYRRARLWYERAAELVGPCIYKRDLRLKWDSGRQGSA